MQRNQDLTRLRLSGGDRALDFRRLEQRGGGMHGDLQLAAGGIADILGERDQVHRMRIVRRIGRREIPFGLRHYGSGKRRDADGHSARFNKPEHDNTLSLAWERHLRQHHHDSRKDRDDGNRQNEQKEKR